MRDCLGWEFSNDCCWLATNCWTPPPLKLSGSSGPLDAGIRKALGRSKRARGDTLSFVSQILSSIEWLNSWSSISLVSVAVWLQGTCNTQWELACNKPCFFIDPLCTLSKLLIKTLLKRIRNCLWYTCTYTPVDTHHGEVCPSITMSTLYSVQNSVYAMITLLMGHGEIIRN